LIALAVVAIEQLRELGRSAPQILHRGKRIREL
jgi:hypothetical protein